MPSYEAKLTADITDLWEEGFQIVKNKSTNPKWQYTHSIKTVDKELPICGKVVEDAKCQPLFRPNNPNGKWTFKAKIEEGSELEGMINTIDKFVEEEYGPMTASFAPGKEVRHVPLLNADNYLTLKVDPSKCQITVGKDPKSAELISNFGAYAEGLLANVMNPDENRPFQVTACADLSPTWCFEPEAGPEKTEEQAQFDARNKKGGKKRPRDEDKKKRPTGPMYGVSFNARAIRIEELEREPMEFIEGV